MKYRIAYQNGGFSQDFYDALDTYSGQQDQGQDEQEAVDNTQEEGQESGQASASPYNEDYIKELEQKYSDLEERLKSLEGGSKSEDDDQAFFNFLFDGSDNNSPANIDPSLFKPRSFSSAGSASSGFRSFATPEEGRNALLNQLNLYQTGKTKTGVKPTSTLYEAMATYAPASDKNDPKGYADFVAKKLGVSPDTPIKDLDPKGWADAITIMEGNKKGNNPGNLRKFQMGGTDHVSMMGYSEDSPYKHNPYLFINTPTGGITMENTKMPLMGIGSDGEKKMMMPGKKYKFNSNIVKEIPLK